MSYSSDAGRCRHPDVVVVGQAGRDLVLAVEVLPAGGDSTSVHARGERLGGKGANQAVGLTQLGASVALVAVLGLDAPGDEGAREAVGDGIDLRGLVRRGRTALLVDIVEHDGTRRLLEDVPSESLLRPMDVAAARDLLESADTVCLQLQQPARSLLTALAALRPGARVVLDGATDDAPASDLLARADVLRADAHETEQWIGSPVRGTRDAVAAAEALHRRGPKIVALAVPDEGDLVSWGDGWHLYPFGTSDVVDPTGAGDAYLAGLVTGLRQGLSPRSAGHSAADAAASTVSRLGGRPDLQPLRTSGKSANGETVRDGET